MNENNTRSSFKSLLFITTVFFVYSCQYQEQKNGMFYVEGSASKDIVIEKYIDGLQKSDMKAVKSLVANGLDSEKAVQSKIDLYKDRTIQVQQISYYFGEKSSIVNASISGVLITNQTGQKNKFTEKITLLGKEGGWFLGLGTPNAIIPKNNQQTTAPVVEPKSK